MEILKFRKGDIIFEEGDLEDWMYEIRKGMVGIYAGYGTPAEKELTVLEEEQIPGLVERIARFTEIFKKNR